MSDRDRRYSKRELLGNLHVDYMMSVTDLGLAARSNRWDVLRAFLAVGEARAERLVEEEDGFLILQSVPGQANTGGIYLFAEPLQSFFWLRFDHNEDSLKGEDFQFAMRVYHLLNLIDGKRKRAHRRHSHGSNPFPVPGGIDLRTASMVGMIWPVAKAPFFDKVNALIRTED